MRSKGIRDHWRTLECLKQALEKELRFDLDPCPLQSDWTPGIHQNGLDLDDWSGKRVFCSPPESNILRNSVHPIPRPPAHPALPQRTSEPIERISVALYPGGKQWLIQQAAEFFRAHPCRTLIEPFAGSGNVGFSLLRAGIIERLVLVEMRPQIAFMLQGIVNDPTLADEYAEFDCTRANVIELLRTKRSATKPTPWQRSRRSPARHPHGWWGGIETHDRSAAEVVHLATAESGFLLQRVTSTVLSRLLAD